MVLARKTAPVRRAASHVESPTVYAARLAETYSATHSSRRRSVLGQYFTPVDIARFMASLSVRGGVPRRILDPGAGTGILACAVCEAVPRSTREIHVDAFEEDSAVAALCAESLRNASDWLERRGVKLTFTIHNSDFVIECAKFLAPGLFDTHTRASYDLVISNPPYFKLAMNDPRSIAAGEVIYGQPNIYAIFMSISASLLADGGVMVTITPRSFAAGEYFSRSRQHIFSRVIPEAVHLFHSRKAAFRSDSVLQENVILRAKRATADKNSVVEVSTSDGPADIAQRISRSVSLRSVVDPASPKPVFHIPAEDTDDAVIEFIRAWPHTLRSLGLEVSTGPVVAFRAGHFLANDLPEGENGSVPLLWLHNVRPMAIEWPLRPHRKVQSIRDSDASRKILVENKTYVVLRRFTAKEEPRRLTVAPLLKGTLPGRMLGLENHLNYIHRPGGEMDDREAFGLAALLGSSLMDRYFRVFNGNTQVNAAELRNLPLPARDVLMHLGQEAQKNLGLPVDIDLLVEGVVGVPRNLLRLLKAG